jgi:hypothetical protein
MRSKSLLQSRVIFLILAILCRGEGFSQNVGIGTATPAYRLDVSGVINSTSEYRLSVNHFFVGVIWMEGYIIILVLVIPLAFPIQPDLQTHLSAVAQE